MIELTWDNKCIERNNKQKKNRGRKWGANDYDDDNIWRWYIIEQNSGITFWGFILLLLLLLLLFCRQFEL